MAGRFTVEAVFKAVDKMSAPVKRMSKGMGKFTRGAERGLKRVDKQLAKVTAGAKKFGAGLLVGAGLIGGAFVNITKAGAEFGRAIGSAAAKFPDDIKRGTKEFKELEQAARDVGSATEFTATEAAQGLGFLAKAGFDAKFSMGALGDIVNFATSSELDLATASDIASDALGAFGMNSKDPIKRLANLNEVMDVMSKTANSSNTSVEELFEAVKKGAPVAIKAGQSLQTYAAVAGTLAGVGIKGSEAGTATKNIALALAGVGNQAGKTFAELNIPLTDNAGKMRDVADVFDDLSGKLAGVDEDKMLGIMNSIFGKISLASAANLLGEGADGIRKLRKTLDDATGSSKTTAQFIRNDVKGSIDSLNSAVEGVKISIFSLNEGPLKEVIDRMTNWVRANEELIASGVGDFFLMIINNIDEIVSTVKKVAVGLAIFMAFTAILKTFIVVMMAVNLAMAMNPLGLMVLGVMAGVTAFGLLLAIIAKVSSKLDLVSGPMKLLSKIFGGGEDQAFVDSLMNRGGGEGAGGGPQVLSKEERVGKQIEENRTTNYVELGIKDETGRGEVTGSGGPGFGLEFLETGAF